MSQIGDQCKSEKNMPLADCPVAAMARDFALTVSTINKYDDVLASVQGEEAERAWQAHDEAWEHLYELQDVAMAADARSQTGIALQLALGIDELVQLETMALEHELRERKFMQLRNVMRRALLVMDPRIASQLGVIELFVGFEFADQFKRKNVAPLPS